MPAALAGVLVYTYPVIVAVLSLRFATRLPGRRPWIALGLAVVGSVLALGGIDVGAAPPIERPAACLGIGADLLGLDHPVGPAVRGAARPTRERRAGGRRAGRRRRGRRRP